MKGYAIIDRNYEGKASVGFQKILSAIQKYEAYKDWAESNADKALEKALNEMTPLSRWEKFKWYMRDVKSPRLTDVLCERHGGAWSDWMERIYGVNTKEVLVFLKVLNPKHAWGLSHGSLGFVHQKDEYNALRNIIRNGGQFILDQDLCIFVNYWNRKEIPQ